MDNHFRMFGDIHTKLEEEGVWDWEVYVYGFIVITSTDWKEQGITALHFQQDRGKWIVLEVNKIPVSEMSHLQSVSSGRSTFDELLDYYEGGANDGPDSKGGLEPIGEWQFVVYCTDSAGQGSFNHIAERKIPDPRNNAGWQVGDACLCFLHDDLAAEEVNENFTLAYANLVKDPTAYHSVCKRHPSLFVHIRNVTTDIQIVKMEWDHDILRTDEELMTVGCESKTSTQECDADSLVSTLQQLAEMQSSETFH